MAARAHDVAAIALRGESAVLNFVDSAWLLPHAASGSGAEEIRHVASKAAEMFRPAGKSAPLAADQEQRLGGSRAPPAVYVDEEALFNLPGLMREMAEGLMVSPPGMKGGGFDWVGTGDQCDHMDMSLWSN